MKNIEPFEQAILDYICGDESAAFDIHYEGYGSVNVPVEKYINNSNFPLVENTALQLCKGKVLDAGAGIGRHSIWLQQNGLSVTSIDTCKVAVGIMKLRGLTDVRMCNYFDLKDELFDTIIMLNRGIGMCNKLSHLPNLLEKSREILSESGKLLVDSTSMPIPQCKNHKFDYFEPFMRIDYDGIEGHRFQWLYIDSKSLKKIAEKYGWNFEILEEEKGQYLCMLTPH